MVPVGRYQLKFREKFTSGLLAAVTTCETLSHLRGLEIKEVLHFQPASLRWSQGLGKNLADLSSKLHWFVFCFA